MKKKFTFKFMLLLCALIVGTSSVWADDPVVVYEETFGTPSANTNVSSFTDWTATAAMFNLGINETVQSCYSGNKVGAGDASTTTDYTVASGSGNAFQQGTANTTTTILTVQKINISGKTSLTFNAGLRNGGAATYIKVYYQIDNGTKTEITLSGYSASTGWHYVSGSISGTGTNLKLFFEHTPTKGWLSRIDDIKVTGVASTPTYTITAVSNNESYGTVSGTTTITANPVDGYRVIAGDGGYTVTAGTATVTNNGDNTFTVVPSSDCTVRINFEAIPPHTLSSVVTPDGAGTVTLGSASVLEGSTTTASVTANAGFEFTEWSISGTGASLSSTTDNPTTVTMGTANATITATFTAVVTHEIKWSVNGTIIKTENVKEGNAITFSDPTSGIPAGYTFKGWVIEDNLIDGFTNTDPSANYVTSANSTKNLTYYAVIAESSMTEPSLTKLGSDATFSTDDNIVIVAQGTTYALYQETVNTSYVANYTFENNAATIGSDSKNYLTLTKSDDSWILGDATNDYLYNSGSNNNLYVNNNQAAWTIAWNSTKEAFTIKTARYLSCRTDLDSDNANLYRMGGTGTSLGVAFFDIYKFTPSTLTYNHFCTEINTFKTVGNWNAGTNWSWDAAPTTEPSVSIKAVCTIPDGVTANVKNIIIGTGGSLIIEDGGQLVCSNSVAATVHKTIDAWDADNKTGWYLLASPIQDATITSISNLITGKYDLFRYNEPDNMWQVYNASEPAFPSFENGRGYLYRNGAEKDVTFTGNTNTSVTYPLSYSNEDENLMGFNIIGNPFTHSITWEDDITLSNVNEVGYYTLGKDGGWAVHKDDDLETDIIAPMQGFLVQANDENSSVTFGAAKKNNKTKANNDYIKLMVSNSQYNDVTYALFDKGDGINKIDHRNAEIPMLYIPQDGKNYAIATMGDDTQMFNLSFKAMTMGKYTISMNAKGNFRYIHLIDRLTGDDTNLLIEDYSFIGSPQDNAERFIVKLNYDNGSSTGSETFAYQSGNEIIVNGEGTLEVYDVTGRKVIATTINGVETINGLSSGVYIFRVIGETLKTQKIVVR